MTTARRTLGASAVLAITWLLSSGCDRGESPAADGGDQPAAVTPSDGPDIQFQKYEHDFGTVIDTQQYEAVFTFTNRGNETLEITGLSTSCDCLDADLSGNTFAPGEGGVVSMTLSPRGEGGRRFVVNVVSNDDAEPVAKLHTSAFVEPLAIFDPTTVEFGKVELGRPQRAYVTFFSRDPGLMVTDLKAESPYILGTALEEDQAYGAPPREDRPGRRAVVVTLSPQTPWGFMQTNLVVTLTGRNSRQDKAPVDKILRVPVRASVFGSLQARPDRYLLSLIPIGGTISKSIDLHSVSGDPFTIISADIAQSTLPGLEVTVVPDFPAPQFRITLSGVARDYKGPIEGVVRVRTNIPGEQTLDIPFSGVASSGVPGG